MKRAFLSSLACGWRRVEPWTRTSAFVVLLAWSVSASGNDYETAHRLVKKGKWAEALPLLEELYSEAPNSSLVAHDLAQTLLRMNRRGESMKLFRKFGSAKTADIAARTFLLQDSYRLYQEGLNFLEAQKLNLARERFEKAYALDRDQLQILLRLIQVETLDLRPDSALSWVQVTRNLHGKNPEMSLWEGRALYLVKRYDDAAKSLQYAVKELPQSENAAVALAEVYYAQKNWNVLSEFLDADLKRNPLHVRVLTQKIRWDLDQFPTSDVTEAEVLRQLTQLESRLEKLTKDPRPRLESELGLELLDLDQLKQDLVTLKSRSKDLKKRSAL